MFHSITSRLITLLILCSAVIIGSSMLVDYRMSRDALLERLQIESQDTIRSAIIDMENWLDGVEGSTLFLARILEQRDYSQAGLGQMLKDIVENNQDIFGAAIALNPELVDSPLGFAPYYFHKDGILTYVDLASETLNYQGQSWYLDTLSRAKPLWIEPYYDEAGGEVLMTTFAVPVYRADKDGERFLYAVVTADVALAELHGYLQRLHLGNNGWGTLFSRSGIILSDKSPANIMRHYSEAISDELDIAAWNDMFNSALAGQPVTRQLECPGIDGKCVMRLGVLKSTGWPVGVIYSEAEMLAPLREFQIETALTALGTLLLMALAVYVVTSRLTRPLTALAHASDNIARGKLDVPLPSARGKDEVARLVRSFTAMKKDLKTYLADLEAVTASRSRLEGELAAAREIQMSMLPGNGEACEEPPAYSLWARVRPAKSVGGDLYAFHRSGDALFLAVGDVSDKGVPAALFMARATSLIQQVMIAETDPVVAMARLNNALEAGNDNCMFITLFLGVMDLGTRQLHYASAGHTPPSLLRGGMVSVIDQDDGPALGLAADLQFPANTLLLQPGDRLAIYTDGIDEAFNEQAQMFGIERFNTCLAATGSSPVAPAGMDIFEAVDQYAGARPQSDDITLMLLQMPLEEPHKKSAKQTFHRGERLVGRVLDWLEQTLHSFAVPQDSCMELCLVAEEIVSNIDKYAGLPEAAAVDVTLEADPTRVSLETRDEGIAFDPLRQGHRSPLGADIETAEIGGLGVHLITQFTDQQSYTRIDGRNILRVVKSLPTDTA